jgi:hypothetical protein
MDLSNDVYIHNLWYVPSTKLYKCEYVPYRASYNARLKSKNGIRSLCLTMCNQQKHVTRPTLTLREMGHPVTTTSEDETQTGDRRSTLLV